MLASLHAPPLLSVLALLGIAPEETGDSSLWSALAGVLLIGGVLWLIGKVMQSDPEPPASRRVTPVPASAPLSRRIPRRVILLHAVTPGQSRHEYNVGDQWGTRGTALVRAA